MLGGQGEGGRGDRGESGKTESVMITVLRLRISFKSWHNLMVAMVVSSMSMTGRASAPLTSDYLRVV